jgi:hypothetical protein
MTYHPSVVVEQAGFMVNGNGPEKANNLSPSCFYQVRPGTSLVYTSYDLPPPKFPVKDHKLEALDHKLESARQTTNLRAVDQKT